MSKTIEFYFDFGSPTSYLAYTQLPRIAADTGAALVYKPVLLGGIFQATGNSSPVALPAKARNMMRDLQRFSARYGVPLNLNPYFPINTLELMRRAVGLQLREPGRFAAYVDTVFRAVWVERQNMADAAVMAAVLQQAGFDAAALAALAAEPEVKERLKAETAAAVERGLFGVPAMFVGEEMFFGQDRLDFVREALAGA
ncbi:MAG: 2-hydroxychromene-2-carboxylate isomerase [Nevskia sp.]|nr:2-hydroxychromene-2-carboxylate isomerase [Nevskia sp.]